MGQRARRPGPPGEACADVCRAVVRGVRIWNAMSRPGFPERLVCVHTARAKEEVLLKGGVEAATRWLCEGGRVADYFVVCSALARVWGLTAGLLKMRHRQETETRCIRMLNFGIDDENGNGAAG